MFVTHARNAEELRLEVISDIRRRMANLDSYARLFVKSEREKAKVARANIELENMLHFWEELVIQGKTEKSDPRINPTKARDVYKGPG